MSLQRRTTLMALAAGAAGGLAMLRVAAAQPMPSTAAAKGDLVVWPEVRLLDGQPFVAPHLRQRAAVLVFFSTTCPYCQRHNPHVQKLADAAVGLPLDVLGVAQDRSADVVRRYQARAGLRFAVTLDESALRPLLSARRVIPLTCVLDRAGRLQEVIAGEMFEDDVLGLARWARA